VVRHIFQACPVWIYTQSNITSILYRYHAGEEMLYDAWNNYIYKKTRINVKKDSHNTFCTKHKMYNNM
jgi:hypothetical protein